MKKIDGIAKTVSDILKGYKWQSQFNVMSGAKLGFRAARRAVLRRRMGAL